VNPIDGAFQERGGAAGAWLGLPSLIEIDYRMRGFRDHEQPTSGFMRHPGRFDVTSLGEGACVVVEQRDQCAP
jgi:hypothetical protein